MIFSRFNNFAFFLFCLLTALFSTASFAQGTTEAGNESIQIGLSLDKITISSDFSGTDLTIFGSIDGADFSVLSQGHYDVIVVLEGPRRDIMVRRKERVFGIWVNTDAEAFHNVPASYSMATTRARQDIATNKTFKQLSLGADVIYFSPLKEDEDPEITQEFSKALRETMQHLGLFTERPSGVTFLSRNLFRASLSIPASVPVGAHRARAFLFRNGQFVDETSAPLIIEKAGLGDFIYEGAQKFGFIYGILAVILAVVTGWLGRIIFKRD